MKAQSKIALVSSFTVSYFVQFRIAVKATSIFQDSILFGKHNLNTVSRPRPNTLQARFEFDVKLRRIFSNETHELDRE